MTLQRHEAKVHRIFEVALLLKAVHSVVEMTCGVLLAVTSTDTMLRMAKVVTQGELLEDSHDLIANYVLRTAQGLSVSSKAATAIFLLSHGTVKLALVVAVMRGWRWAYPAFIGALGLLISYQSYQLWVGFSVGLAVLTVVDLLVLSLTMHEYRLVRATAP